MLFEPHARNRERLVRAGSIILVVALTGLLSPLALGLGLTGEDKIGVWDEPGQFFPGKYFEQKAQFYLKNKKYQAALEMFELSGFWADKISQYNAGLMYFNGIGVAVDKPRGVAWLGIAAEAHDDLAEHAFKLGYAQLSAPQQAQADAIRHELEAKYSDQVTVPRAVAQYEADSKQITGSHLGHVVGNLSVQEFGGESHGMPETGNAFLARKDKEFTELLSKITGHVSVGAVRPLEVPDDARVNASNVPLDVGSQ
jgi:hypothetical protein